MIKIFKALNYVMIVLFIFAAVVQYNDPDSFLWIGVYGLAALFSILWVRNKTSKAAAIVFAVIAIAWSAWVVPESSGQDAFATYSMQNIEVEETRESMGLLFVGIWMLLLAFVPQPKPVETAPTVS